MLTGASVMRHFIRESDAGQQNRPLSDLSSTVKNRPDSVTHAGLIRRLFFGHCSRWHPDAPTTGMESSPAIGAGIIPSGSFLATRLRALDPFRTVSVAGSGHSDFHLVVLCS